MVKIIITLSQVIAQHCLSYAGYGHIAPKTEWGMVVTVLYAIFGIPLTLFTITNLGSIMATAFRFLYQYVCCGLCCLFCTNQRRRRRTRRGVRSRRPGSAQGRRSTR